MQLRRAYGGHVPSIFANDLRCKLVLATLCQLIIPQWISATGYLRTEPSSRTFVLNQPILSGLHQMAPGMWEATIKKGRPAPRAYSQQY